MSGIVLTFETDYEDGTDGHWTAEAQHHSVPFVEASGDTPLNAVMVLAGLLAAMVSAERVQVALDRVESAQLDAGMSLTPEQAVELQRAKERLAAKRAGAGQ